MLTIYYRKEKKDELKALETFRPDSWVYTENPSEEELRTLVLRHNLEEGHLRDALDIHEVPRLEREGDVTYIFTRFAYRGEDLRIATAPVLIAAGPDFVLTISMRRPPFLEKFLSGKMAFATVEREQLLIRLFVEIVAGYNTFLTDIGRRVRAIAVDLEKIGNKEIVQLVSFEAILNDFLTGLVPTQAILNTLLADRSFAQEKDRVEDMFLGIGQLIAIGKSHLKNMVNIREAYSTIVTNNLNSVIKLLTVVTVMLTIPMMIGSFYGMNVPLPFGHAPHAFWGVLGISFAISASLFMLFKGKRWI